MNKQVTENNNSQSAASWREFTDLLATAGDSIFNEFGATSARERAEGLRYLTRLISIGLDMHLEHVDSAHPTFTRIINDTRKFIGDNPDAEYDYATLDGQQEYCIRGHRGVSEYLGFCLYGRNAEGATTVDANINDAEMDFAADGSFELYLSKQNSRGMKNWLPLTDDTYCILVRQYFIADRSQRGTYSIKCLTPAAKPAVLDETTMHERLMNVAHFVRDTSAMSAALSIFSALNSVSSSNLAEGEAYHSPELVDGKLISDEQTSVQDLAAKIDPKIISGHMPTLDIQYSGAWWTIRPGEAVVIEGKALKSRYWSLQIFNRWMESPDYRYDKVHTNSAEVHYEEDGSFIVVLAPEDKGFRNWISTNGFSEGQVCFRALLAESAPQITYRIETVSSLLAQQQA